MQFASRGVRSIPPAGLHNGVITGLYNIGSIWDPFKNGYRTSLIMTIQLETADADGKPLLVTKTLTGSMDPKATLRLWVEALASRQLSEIEASQLDVSKFLLGRSCQLNLIHDQKTNGETTYKIKSILPSTATIQPVKPPVEWDYRNGDLASCPEWIARRHAQSREYKSKYPAGNGPIEQRLQAPSSGFGANQRCFTARPGSATSHVPGGLAAAAGTGPDDFDF